MSDDQKPVTAADWRPGYDSIDGPLPVGTDLTPEQLVGIEPSPSGPGEPR